MKHTARKFIAGAAAAVMALTAAGFEGALPISLGVTAAAGGITINEELFPDMSLRNYVLLYIDADRDGSLSAAEIAAVKTLDVSNKKIESVKGIGIFTALEELNIGWNNIASADLTANTALKKLICDRSNMESLDISACAQLESIDAVNNRFKTLDLSENKKLTYIHINSGYNGVELKTLTLPETGAVTTLNISNFDIAAGIDLSGYTKLSVAELNNCGLTGFDAADFPELTKLWLSNNDISEIDLSGCPKLTNLVLDGNPIEELDVSALPELKGLSAAQCSLYDVDVSANKKLTSLDVKGCDQIGSLDLSGNPELNYLSCSGASMRTLDLRNNVNLSKLDAAECGLYELYLGSKPKLQYLNVADNMLTDVDTEYASGLVELNCARNQVSFLYLDECTALKTLDCSGNALISLELGKCKALTKFSGTGNSAQRESNGAGLSYSRIEELENAVYDPVNGVFHSITGVVSYKYATGLTGKYLETSIDFGATEKFDITAQAANGEVTLYWKPIIGAQEYVVSKYDAESNTYKSVETTRNNSFYMAGLSQNETAKFKIRAKMNSTGGSVVMSDVIALCPDEFLGPQEFTATESNGSVTLAWSAVEGADSYRVYRINNTIYSVDVIADTKYLTTADNPLTECVYSYYVVAVRGSDISNPSQYRQISLLSDTRPKNVEAVAGDRTVTVTWDDVKGASQYKIDVFTNTDGEWKLYKTVTDDGYRCVSPKIVENLTNGTEYGFIVSAMVAGEWSESAGGDMVFATPESNVNIVPQNVKASAGDGKVTLTWDAVEGATNYAVFLRKGSEWLKIGTTGTGTAFTSRGLPNGGKYFYIVKAYVDGVWSDESAVVSAIPTCITPQNVKASAGDGKVTLTWDAVEGATNYAVFLRKGSEWLKIGTTGTGTAFTSRGLPNGGKYFYMVKAYVDGVWSDQSAVVSAIPMCITPQNVKAAGGAGKADITWDEVKGASTYAVMMKKGAGWITLGSTGAKTSYTATGLASGGKYYFAVKAYVGGSWSDMSQVVAANIT